MGETQEKATAVASSRPWHHQPSVATWLTFPAHCRPLSQGGLLQHKSAVPSVLPERVAATADTPMITVTAKLMSGAIAFGPEAVLKTLTVGELKNFWDSGAPKEIMFGGKLMQDHETLDELPLQTELVVAIVCLANTRAQAAAAALEGVDRNAFLRDKRGNPGFMLEYTWCLMALEAVYGRDAKVWRECMDFGCRIPTLPKVHSYPTLIKSGEIRAFQNFCWPNGSVFPAEPLLEALRRLDHLALERAMNANIEFKNEFQSLLAVHDLSSTLLGSWLDASVKPLLLE